MLRFACSLAAISLLLKRGFNGIAIRDASAVTAHTDADAGVIIEEHDMDVLERSNGVSATVHTK